MELETFEEGDVVVLRSDSDNLQRMTVAHINGNIVKCVWFYGGFPYEYEFKRTCLVKCSTKI